MKKFLFIFAPLFFLTSCGDLDADYDNNLLLVQNCISAGGHPEFNADGNGRVIVYYGCRLND